MLPHSLSVDEQLRLKLGKDAPEASQDFNYIRSILQLPPQNRTSQDIANLLNFTSDIEFFKKLSQESTAEAHLKCCQQMRYEFLPAHSTVFNFGEKGQKFYIIIKGAVRVLIPCKGQDGLYDAIGLLGKGASFGELALTKNMPRAARIVCKDETHFATLHKQDFKAILGTITEQALNSRVNFLQGLPLFSFWTKKSLMKLSYYFRELRLVRKQVVFAEGESGDDLFFIKQGEFQLSKIIQHSSVKGNLKKACKVLYNAHIALLGENEFFGDDDAIENRPRSTTCVCHSSVGVLLVIAKEPFFQRLNAKDITTYLKTRNEAKRFTRSKRLENFSALMTKGRLELESPNSLSPPRTARMKYHRSESLTLKHNNESSPTPTKLIQLPSNGPKFGIEPLKLKKDGLISVLSLTQRLWRPKTRRVRSPKPRPLVNIHTHRARYSSVKESITRTHTAVNSSRTTPTKARPSTISRIVAPASRLYLGIEKFS